MNEPRGVPRAVNFSGSLDDSLSAGGNGARTRTRGPDGAVAPGTVTARACM